MSPSSSSVLARAAGLACTVYTCTVTGRDCTTVRGPGLGPGRVISLDTAIVTSTQSQSVSHYTVLLQWERESCPGLCTPTCTSPSVLRANVRAPCACTDNQDHKLEVKIWGKPFPWVTEDQVKLRLNPAKHLKLNQWGDFPNSYNNQHTLAYCVIIISSSFLEKQASSVFRVQCSISWWNDGKRPDMTSSGWQNIRAGSNSVFDRHPAFKVGIYLNGKQSLGRVKCQAVSV